MEALPMPHIRCLVEVSPNPKLCRIVWSVFAAAEMQFPSSYASVDIYVRVLCG